MLLGDDGAISFFKKIFVDIICVWGGQHICIWVPLEAVGSTGAVGRSGCEFSYEGALNGTRVLWINDNHS